jgi:hypothetical protein
MAGQARNIIWQDQIQDKYGHREEISYLLRKLEMKANAIRNATTDEARAEANKDWGMGINGIYTVQFKGVKYYYVVLKNTIKAIDDKTGEVISEQNPTNNETYSAYLIRHEKGKEAVNYFMSKKDIKEQQEQFGYEYDPRTFVSQLADVAGSPFKNGWYKAQEDKVYGRRFYLAKDGSMNISKYDNEKGFDFGNLNSIYLNNQPNDQILGATVKDLAITSEDPSLKYEAFWPTIFALRRAYNSIGDDMLKQAKMEQEQLNKWLNEKLPLLRKEVGKYIPEEELKKFFSDANRMFGLNQRFFFDPQTGNIVTPNSRFLKKSGNYVPYLYEDDTILEMLDKALEEVGARIAALPDDDTSDRRKRLQTEYDQLSLSYAKLMGDKKTIDTLSEQLGIMSDDIVSKLTVAQRNVYTKHREEWTDTAKRKKDSEVIEKYIDHVYGSFSRNALMGSMLDTMSTIIGSKMEGHQKRDLTLWLANRTKIAMSDPTAEAGIGNFSYSYVTMAKWMNKWIPGRREWDEESVRRLVNYTKGTLSALLLGHSGAMINRTQIINPAIGTGWSMVSKTAEILADNDSSFPLEKALAIINQTGVEEVSNFFMDNLGHGGGSITLADAGLISLPWISTPIPKNTWFDFLNMIKNNRQAFIEKGIPELDKRLAAIDLERIRNMRDKSTFEQERAIINAIGGITKMKLKHEFNVLQREYERVTSPGERRSIQELRQNFIDLLLTPKHENNAKTLRMRYKKVMGDVGENRMKRMIAWKLSWWWTGAGKELFTFTESERYMRRQTALMALLNARSMGLLGTSKGETEVSYRDANGNIVTTRVEDVYLTDDAIRIARNAVADTMFGMSQNNLGDAFGGLGAQLFLYKAYPLNQMIHDWKHDWKILETYMAGNVNKQQAIKRLMDAFMLYLEKGYAKVMRGEKWEYNPNAAGFDHEAIAMVRFLLSRVSMSIFSIMAEVFGLMRFMLRTPISKVFSSMLRGGENPLLGILLRLGANALILSMFDDDEEPSPLGVGWDIARLFFPVFLTLPLQLIIDWAS